MDDAKMERLWQLAPAFVEGIPHAKKLGMKFISLDQGRATISLPYNRDFVGNAKTGILHGGAITTLLDQTCGLAVVTATMANREESILSTLATLDLRIDYLRAAKIDKTVFAMAHCYKVTRHIAFVRGIAHDGDENDPVATCQSTFMITIADNTTKADAQIDIKKALS